MTRRLRVVGLDLSLASSGMSDGSRHYAVQTDAGEDVEDRLDQQLAGVRSFVLAGYEADLVVIEAGAFSRGAQSAAAEYLSALRLMVRHMLWKHAVPFAMVPPSTLKLATTGYGKASKQEMVAAVDERHGTNFRYVMVKDGRYDLADALALAAMGYARVGQPLPCHYPATPVGTKSLAAVKWPPLLSSDA